MENMNTPRNQLVNEQTQNLKNPFWVYVFIGFSAIIVIVVLFVLFFGSSASDNETKQKDNTSYDSKEKRKTISSVIEDKSFDKNITANAPSLAFEPGKTIQKKSKIVISKTGVVVGEAANKYFYDDQNSLEFKKAQVLFNFGQTEDNAGNITPKISGTSNDNGEIYSPTAAYFSAFNQNLLLAKGTYIGCSLKTRLVSDIKGGIACVVSNDVYSNNGKILLIEKGSLVTGTYSGASIEEGMERIYVIWQEIRTPNNIIIPVFSGASDELGGAGIQGWVDNHYFKRFGSAILISVIDDFTSALAARISEKNTKNDNTEAINYYTPESTTKQANNLATKTLEKMIDIKPTLYKNHGDVVGIYVNRDIDFRNVYKLQRKK